MKNSEFDSQAEGYDKSEKRRRTVALIADRIMHRIKLSGSERVIDFGAGTGLLSLFLASRVKEIIAIDRSKEMLKALRGKTLSGWSSCQATLNSCASRSNVISRGRGFFSLGV